MAIKTKKFRLKNGSGDFRGVLVTSGNFRSVAEWVKGVAKTRVTKAKVEFSQRVALPKADALRRTTAYVGDFIFRDVLTKKDFIVKFDERDEYEEYK